MDIEIDKLLIKVSSGTEHTAAMMLPERLPINEQELEYLVEQCVEQVLAQLQHGVEL